MHRRDFARITAAGLAASLGFPSLRRIARDPVTITGERLLGQLRALAQYGINANGGVSRVAYSEADVQGRAYVTGLMREAGLEVRVDAAANLIGRRSGTQDGLPPIMFGSHIDSVPDGGNYDGTVGSLAAIEAARTLGERNLRTRHPLEVIVFQNEEGGLVGSRALSGELEPDHLTRKSHSGKTIGEGTALLGGDLNALERVTRARGEVTAYIELHIEQGGVLEREARHIGIVSGIVGIGWWDVTVTGFSNHAGTTPMDQRQDALLAAARFIQAVNRIVTSEPGRQVGTVGRIEVEPGVPNVIAGEVRLSLELRDLDAAKTTAIFERIHSEAKAIGTASGTTFAFTPTFHSLPAPADDAVRNAIAAAAGSLGLTTMAMPSGAGHDAQSVARFAPIGMLFIPSVGGISHSPKELSRAEDVVRGANVLLNAVLAVDSG
jgi:N-carbamoyl-L-amino-acid hydrolase